MALVNDSCDAMQFLSYAQEDLSTTSLRELYIRSCHQLAIRKPNQVILDQLPRQVGEHHQLITLSCAKTYLGCRGLVALCPVIEVCYRLTHLDVKGVGMKAAAGKTLLNVLTVHPGIRCLNISCNDLGTTVATQLLSMLQKHRRIYDVQFEKILVIEPLKKKIEKQLSVNHDIMNSFSIPLIPEDSDDAEMVKKRQLAAEERARVEREIQYKREQSERIPPWGPAALLEVSECLWKHREHMEDVFSVFDKGSRNPLIPPKHFQRGMRILGINTLQHDVVRCTDFCEMFGAWHRAENEVNYVTIINTLRIHVVFTPPEAAGEQGPSTGVVGRMEPTSKDASEETTFPGTSTEPEAMQGWMLDHLFDSRVALQQSFEVLDIDQTGFVPYEETMVGTLSMLHVKSGGLSAKKVKRKITNLLDAFLGLSVEEAKLAVVRPSIPYAKLLKCFRVPDDVAPRKIWTVKRSEVLAMVEKITEFN